MDPLELIAQSFTSLQENNKEVKYLYMSWKTRISLIAALNLPTTVTPNSTQSTRHGGGILSIWGATVKEDNTLEYGQVTLFGQEDMVGVTKDTIWIFDPQSEPREEITPKQEKYPTTAGEIVKFLVE